MLQGQVSGKVVHGVSCADGPHRLGDRWATPEGGTPLVFRHRSCGYYVTPTVTCDACGQPLRAGDIEALPGPGARTGPGTAIPARVLYDRADPNSPGRGSAAQGGLPASPSLPPDGPLRRARERSAPPCR